MCQARQQTSFLPSKVAPLNNPRLEGTRSCPSLGCLVARRCSADEGQKVHQRSVVFPGVLTPASCSLHPSLDPQQLPQERNAGPVVVSWESSARGLEAVSGPLPEAAGGEQELGALNTHLSTTLASHPVRV